MVTDAGISRDLQYATAVREAARLVVAIATGGRAQSRIWQTRLDDITYSRIWRGSTQVITGGQHNLEDAARRLTRLMHYAPDTPVKKCLREVIVADLNLPVGEELPMAPVRARLGELQHAIRILIENCLFFSDAVQKLMSEGKIGADEADELYRARGLSRKAA